MACKQTLHSMLNVRARYDMTKVRMRWDYFPFFFLLKEWFTFLDNCKIRMFMVHVTLIHLGKTTAQKPAYEKYLPIWVIGCVICISLCRMYATVSQSFYWSSARGRGNVIALAFVFVLWCGKRESSCVSISILFALDLNSTASPSGCIKCTSKHQPI